MSEKIVCLISSVVVLCMVTSASAGLVANWALDETSGTVAADSSGNGNDGTLSADPAPVWVTDAERGNVLEFGPGLGEVNAGAGVGAGADLTVAFWMKPSDKEFQRPISCMDLADADPDYSANPGWFLMLRHDEWGDQVPPNMWFRMTGTEGAWNEGDLWLDASWVHNAWTAVAFTFDEATDTLSGYINGVLAGTTVVPEGRSVGSLTNSLIMGHGGTEDYQGLLDDVYIYDHVLTEAEIQGLQGIPEPATIALLALGGSALLRFRKKH